MLACMCMHACVRADHACHQDPLPPGAKQDTVKIGILLPHEVFASLWEYGNHELFYALLTGTPDDS